VNLGRLEELEGDTFTPEHLLEHGVIKKLFEGLKVLGSGQLTRKLRVEAHLFSKSAVEKIQAAGGEAVLIGGSGAGVIEQRDTEPRA
jgi:large subunit ribosomal protein L15